MAFAFEAFQTIKGAAVNVALLLPALLLIVLVHELAHFVVARWCGVRVKAFSLGFGRELVGRTDRHGTRWRLSAIPLGGYVKFVGDANAASMPAAASPAESFGRGDQGLFHRKKVWQRAAVVAAGPLSNLVLAVVLFAGMAALVGERKIVPRIDNIIAGSAAEEAGIRSGDIVRRIDGREILGFDELAIAIATSPGKTLRLGIERAGQQVTIEATPRLGQGRHGPRGLLGIAISIAPRIGSVVAGGPAEKAGIRQGDTIVDIDGKVPSHFPEIEEALVAAGDRDVALVVERDGRRVPLTFRSDGMVYPGSGRLGANSVDLVVHRFGPIEAVSRGWSEMSLTVTRTLDVMRDAFTKKEAREQIRGPASMAQLAGRAADHGLSTYIRLVALLSIGVGLLNLMPIPMLDGGHLMFYAVEAVRRRPLGPKAMRMSYRFGLAAVGFLMLFALWNDFAWFVLRPAG